jgi:hypothetical protein
MSEERAHYGGQPAVISEAAQFIHELSGYYAVIPDELIRSGQSGAVTVYGALHRIARDQKKDVVASLSYLHEYCGLSIPTIRKALDFLVKEEFIEITFKGTGHLTSRYKLPFTPRTGRVKESVPQGETEGERILHQSNSNQEVYQKTPVVTSEDFDKSSTVPPGVRRKIKQPPKERLITNEFLETMHERFDVVFGVEGTSERIEEALGHKSATKWPDKQAYIRGWLRRDSEGRVGNKGSPPGKTCPRCGLPARPNTPQCKGCKQMLMTYEEMDALENAKWTS